MTGGNDQVICRFLMATVRVFDRQVPTTAGPPLCALHARAKPDVSKQVKTLCIAVEILENLAVRRIVRKVLGHRKITEARQPP